MVTRLPLEEKFLVRIQAPEHSTGRHVGWHGESNPRSSKEYKGVLEKLKKARFEAGLKKD